jgi:hypothetical protein
MNCVALTDLNVQLNNREIFIFSPNGKVSWKNESGKSLKKERANERAKVDERCMSAPCAVSKEGEREKSVNNFLNGCENSIEKNLN